MNKTIKHNVGTINSNLFQCTHKVKKNYNNSEFFKFIIIKINFFLYI